MTNPVARDLYPAHPLGAFDGSAGDVASIPSLLTGTVLGKSSDRSVRPIWLHLMAPRGYEGCQKGLQAAVRVCHPRGCPSHGSVLLLSAYFQKLVVHPRRLSCELRVKHLGGDERVGPINDVVGEVEAVDDRAFVPDL